MDSTTQEKKERLLSALDKGMVMIHLDARRPGVVVPNQFRQEAHLRLNLSYRFDPPDLSVGDWGVRSTLTFSGQRFTVAVPWSALFAVASHVTHEFWLFPEDMPEELVAAAQAKGKEERVQQPPGGKASRPVLRALESVPSEEAMAREAEVTPPPSPEPPASPARGHLRLIK